MLSGQAQKEFFVNQSLAVLDALTPRAVVATLAEPPAQPADGACYRVAQPATGEWVARADQLALSIGGSWHFISPVEGMLMFDQGARRWLCFRGRWNNADAPAAPSGSNVIDVEARAALMQLVEDLRTLGLFPSTVA